MYYNDSLVSELRNMITNEYCTKEPQTICEKLKDDVFDMVSKENEGRDLLSVLRFVKHLRNELICKKDVLSKKK